MVLFQSHVNVKYIGFFFTFRRPIRLLLCFLFPLPLSPRSVVFVVVVEVVNFVRLFLIIYLTCVFLGLFLLS